MANVSQSIGQHSNVETGRLINSLSIVMKTKNPKRYLGDICKIPQTGLAAKLSGDRSPHNEWKVIHPFSGGREVKVWRDCKEWEEKSNKKGVRGRVEQMPH